MPSVLITCPIQKIINSLFETIDSTVGGRIEHFGSNTLQIIDGRQFAHKRRHSTNHPFRLILKTRLTANSKQTCRKYLTTKTYQRRLIFLAYPLVELPQIGISKKKITKQCRQNAEPVGI